LTGSATLALVNTMDSREGSMSDDNIPSDIGSEEDGNEDEGEDVGVEGLNLSAEILNISLPSNLEKDNATENVCTGVQVMGAYNLPYRIWGIFCTTLNIMKYNSEGRETRSFVSNNIIINHTM